MFSQILSVFSYIGTFFTSMAFVAQMPFSDFISMLSGRTLEFFTPNILTGEQISVHFMSISSLINQALSFNPLVQLAGQILILPLRIADWLLQGYSQLVLSIFGLASTPTWIAFIVLFSSFFIPIVILRAVVHIIL